MTRVVIAGGGLAGGLAALALKSRRPEVDLLLVEQQATFGGNHTWSFFDTDVPAEQHWLIDQVAPTHWAAHDIRFPRRERHIAIGYNSIRSRDFDRALRAALPENQYRLGMPIAEVGADAVVLGNGDRIAGDLVIDARGPATLGRVRLGYQKFVGRTYRFPSGHGIASPIIMDASVEQRDGYRFLYFLPFAPDELLIEDTVYSRTPNLDDAELGHRLDAAARRLGKSSVIGQERGVLPLPMDGALDDLWPEGDAVPRLGVRGGFFHPTTSYSLPDAVDNALLLAGTPDLKSRVVATLLRAKAERLWRERRFFRLLNRMLFRAIEPEESYRVLEHFYRLPADLIGRFYGARLSMVDKLRIVSGRPPVPIHRALAALSGMAA